MRCRFFLLSLISFLFFVCQERHEEDLVVAEGRELIQEIYARYSESNLELDQHFTSGKKVDLLHLVQRNKKTTSDLYNGIKKIASKYPGVSEKYAAHPHLLGRQLGTDIRPLIKLVNQLAANLERAMRNHPEKEKIMQEYRELMVIWLKVLTVFGSELKQK